MYDVAPGVIFEWHFADTRGGPKASAAKGHCNGMRSVRAASLGAVRGSGSAYECVPRTPSESVLLDTNGHVRRKTDEVCKLT